MATSKATGNLYEVRKGVWRYREFDRVTADGKEKRRSKTFPAKNLTAAREVVKDLAHQWKQDRKRQAENKGTVGELVADWYQFRVAQKDSPTTLYRTASICKVITADLGHLLCADLGPLEIDRWYGQLSGRGLQPNTVNHYHRVLHAVLRQGRKWRKIAWNPAEDATPPRKDEVDIATPTREEIRTILDGAGRTVRMGAYLAAATGARRGELVALRWSDLNGNKLTIATSLVKLPGQGMVRKTPKTRKPRTITLDVGTLVALEQHRAEAIQRAEVAGKMYAADGPILAHRDDETGATPYAPDWLSQEWERLCARAHKRTVDARKENPDAPEPRTFPFHLHSLRHYHATELIEAGVALPSVSAREGHARISTTLDFYTKATAEADEAAALAIAPALAAILAPSVSS